MTNLDSVQQRLLNNVHVLMNDIREPLVELEDKYLTEAFKMKRPVIEAVQAAQEAGVPFKRIISDEGMGFQYPRKAQQWMAEPELSSVIVQAEQAIETEAALVTRDPKTGIFHVKYNDDTYAVPAIGPDEMPWSTASTTIPQGVYDMIKEHFPAWELLEDED